MNSDKALMQKKRTDLKDALRDFQRRLNGGGKRGNGKALKEFGGVLSENATGKLRTRQRKRLAVEEGDGGEWVKLGKERRRPLRVEAGGKRYTRLCTEGSTGMETLVRVNIVKLITEAMDVGKQALRDRSPEPLIDLCLDPMSGFYRPGYLDTLGNPMKADGRAVQEMIRQFFKDELMVKRLKRNMEIEFCLEKYRAH